MITAWWKENQQGLTSDTNEPVHKWKPLELMAGSLALCMLLSLKQLLERDQVELDSYAVSVTTEKASDRPSRVARLQATISLDRALDSAYEQKLLQTVERVCTVGNTFRQGAQIDATITHEMS